MRIRYTKRALAHLQEFKLVSIRQFGQTTTTRSLSKIDRAIDDLRLFPERGRAGRVAGTRELVVTGTPLIVVYWIEGDVVAILAVIHGARKWPVSLS